GRCQEISFDFGSSPSDMQWKDPELKVRRLTKSDLRCVRRKEQTFSSNASPPLLFDLKGWRRWDFTSEAQRYRKNKATLRGGRERKNKATLRGGRHGRASQCRHADNCRHADTRSSSPSVHPHAATAATL